MIIYIMSCLKSNSSLGHLFPLNVLHSVSPNLINIITGIIRVSLASYIVLQSMKYTYIIPILKSIIYIFHYPQIWLIFKIITNFKDYETNCFV